MTVRCVRRLCGGAWGVNFLTRLSDVKKMAKQLRGATSKSVAMQGQGGLNQDKNFFANKDGSAIKARILGKSFEGTIGTKPHPVAQIHHTTLYVAGVQPVPDDIKLVVGDAIHNLRSSLDHLAWQLVEATDPAPSFYISISLTRSSPYQRVPFGLVRLTNYGIFCRFSHLYFSPLISGGFNAIAPPV